MRLKILILFVMLMSLGELARAEDPVYFAEPALKTAVEEALNRLNPTPTHMLNLTTLKLNFADIHYLTGLEYATNLQYLEVHDNLIGSIAPLAGLTNITHLDLNNNRIDDLSPLSGLTKLTWLDFHDQGVNTTLSDISPLSGMTQLEYLHAYRFHISDVSVLAGLTKLKNLDIHDNLISDLSPLGALPQIRNLQLQNNKISDVSPLTGLTSLGTLILTYNPLSQQACNVDIPQIRANNPGVIVTHDCLPSFPETLTVSSTSGGKVTTPGEGTFTYNYGDNIWIRAFAEPGYIFIGWSGDIVSDEDAVYINMNRDYIIQANFMPLPVSALTELYVDQNGPGDPGPLNPNVSDPNEDGTMSHPFDRIQEAIEVASEGATIIVGPGTYEESIDFAGKSIRVIGIDPNLSGTSAYPVLQGHTMSPVVSFVSGEDANSVLSGFVLTGGQGAILCQDSGGVLSHCLIVGNRSGDLEGVVDCHTGYLRMINCTVAHNTGGIRLVDSDLEMINSIVWGNVNVVDEISLLGSSFALISHSNVPTMNGSNAAGEGNLFSDPLFVRPGYWVNELGYPVINADGTDAVWQMGDYHLQSAAGHWDALTGTWMTDAMSSPCIDGGDPNSVVGFEPEPNGGIINMGAYGGTGMASQSNDEIQLP